MKKTIICSKPIRFIALTILLCFLVCFFPISVKGATKSVTFTNISQYAEIEALTPFTVRWTASGGTVDHYTFSLRYLYNRTEYKNILVYSGETVSASSASFRIPGSVLSPRGLYRCSVCAVIDGQNVWSEILYFYVSSHEPLTSTFNFHIYNDFADASKNAAYYATQAWANALGRSYAATYPYSMGTDEIGDDDSSVGGNGENCISVAWYDTSSTSIAKTITRYDALDRICEIDIYLNRNMPFTNGAQAGKYDVQSVLTHELGHVYGLCDKYQVGEYGSWCTTWTMCGVGQLNSIAPRSLESYDIAHIQSLYS